MRGMQRFAPKIVLISAERIREELVRILTEGGARYGFELLDRSRPARASSAGGEGLSGCRATA